MEIKNNGQTILVKNVVLLTIALLLLILIIVSIAVRKDKYHQRKIDINPIPDQDLQFLQNEVALEEVIDYFYDHTLFLSVKDDASKNLSKETRQKIQAIGGEELSQLSYRDSYVGMIQDGRFVKESRNEEKEVLFSWNGIKLGSAGNDTGNFSWIKTEAERYDAQNRGLYLYVLNSDRQLVGIYIFDFFKTSSPKSKNKSEIKVFKNMEEIEIVLNADDYNRLKTKREEALQKQILLTSDADLVPANIYYQGNEYNSQVRLKGDWVDHLAGEQWSFRVKLMPGETMKGMRKFSLHHPKARNYVGEWLFHQVLADQGILNLKYEFVHLKLRVVDELGNKKESKLLGVYALEEFFDKHLIERGKRREGVILKIDEDPIWQERAAFVENDLVLRDLNHMEEEVIENYNVLPFSEKKIRKDSTLFKQFLTARSLFRSYLEGTAPISEVFDVELLARYNAIINLLGARHALLWHNLRIYYNPINSRLEPIGFDANAMEKNWFIHFVRKANEDEQYIEAFVRAMEELTSEDYINRLLNWPGLKSQVGWLQLANPDYQWDQKNIIHNQSVIRKYIDPVKCLNVFFKGMEEEYFRVNIENYGKFPVVITNLQNDGGRIFGTLPESVIIPANSRQTVSFLLDKNYQKLFISKKKKKSGFDLQSDIDKIQVDYHLLGASKQRKEKILPWNDQIEDQVNSDLFRKAPNAHQFPFLDFDENQKTITCKPGEWQIEKALIIPPGYTFCIYAGSRIDLKTYKGQIISFSPLLVLGSAEQPVEFFSSTKRGRGLLVLNTQDTSLLRYCNFTNLTNPGTSGWVITGAINFYHAPVSISNCSFSNNRCEDALNIFSTHFEMDSTIFVNIHSDAFDGDFVTGSITNSFFGNLGNDAIDISGSEIDVRQVEIIKAGDKGLSAGENSHLIASNLLIKDSEIAVASKDKSILKIKQSRLFSNRLGFTAFQKKSEFGIGKIEADSVRMKDNVLNFLIENGSVLLLDGRLQETVEEVKGRMYGVEFGKESL